VTHKSKSKRPHNKIDQPARSVGLMPVNTLIIECDLFIRGQQSASSIAASI
jgi:hypothetical protein